MTRAPFVMGKAPEAFSRSADIYDTTIGWRFINPLMKAQYGVDAMPETGENVAEEFQVSRADQDAFAIRSQQRAGAAIASGYFAEEITPVSVPGGKAGPVTVDKDEHPRPETTLEGLAKLKPIVRNPGTVTAGNASGVNDGAAAMILASEAAVKKHGLTPRARILGLASAAVPPRIMGIGPVPATKKLMERLGLKISDFDLIELNEAFASQGIAVPAPTRRQGRCRFRQPAWRRDRARPSARHERRAAGDDGGARHGEARRQARARHHVRRRRPGRRGGDREVELTTSRVRDGPKDQPRNPDQFRVRCFASLRNDGFGGAGMTLIYPVEARAHPPRLSPGYKSTVKRSPSKPLIPMRHTLSELTGPVYGHETVRENDNDLTLQRKGEPLGERIIVHGHVLDEDGRGVPNTLVEIWQANACGRYIHVVDQHPAPLDPNFTGAGRAQTDAKAITGSSPSSPAPIRGAIITMRGVRRTSISRCSAMPSSRGW